MFANLKLGAKIVLGFGIILGIAVILGGLGVWNMSRVKTDAVAMDEEYVPEIEIVNEIERNSLLTMYNMRGYAFTQEEKYLTLSKEHLAKVQQSLKDASALAEKSKNLKALKENVGTAQKDVDLYSKLADETVAKEKGLGENRAALNAAAAKYMEESNTYLNSQSESLNNEVGSGVGGEQLRERIKKLDLINDVIDAGNAVRITVWKAQANRDPGALDEAITELKGIEPIITEIRSMTRQEANLKQLDEILAAANDYHANVDSLKSNWHAVEELNTERGKVADEVLNLAKETSIKGAEGIAARAASAKQALATSSMIMIVGLGLALVIGVTLALFITRSITLPVNRIIEALTDGADQVASASGQVSGASQSLAEGAAEQASSLEEVSSSLEEMSSMTRANADNADQANKLASEARSASERGNVATGQMIVAMKKISESSEQTQKIIKTIDEIAFQTNLLALNAAVEAARAGEAGKGFAVVAEEVRNLAQRAGEAARNTAELIEGSVVRTTEGNKIAEETAKALTEITASSTKVSDLVAEIAAASKEQAQGIDQVNIAVGQMDKVTQSNASNAEESASASEELNSQAQNLTTVVEQLQNLVGGSGTQAATAGAVQSHAAAHQSVFSHHPVPGNGSNGNGIKRNGGKASKTLAHAGSLKRDNKPEAIIPLGDVDDFDEF